MYFFATSGLKRGIGILAVLGALLLALQAGGCYYVQAVNGQLEVLRKREPIPELLDDPALAEETRARLGMVLAARRFAVDELLLPDNDSYKTYTDLERDYVVWNVFAAPEFSLEPKTWCFPIVGCVAYRGYFSKQAADRHAARLDARGYDVYVGGVPAYSTLGRFDDPVLNTMMRWSDVDLVATLFHELAHQQLFVKGDTAFNESFATAVAETGLERWLNSRGERSELSRYAARDELRSALMEIAAAAKEDLSALYRSDVDVAEMRQRKAGILDALSARAGEVSRQHGMRGSGWLGEPLNNARLASAALYRGDVGAFRRILERCSGALPCFYAEANRLAALDARERRHELDTLASQDGSTDRAETPAGH